jgi:hypothetical protein
MFRVGVLEKGAASSPEILVSAKPQGNNLQTPRDY